MAAASACRATSDMRLERAVTPGTARVAASARLLLAATSMVARFYNEGVAQLGLS